MDDLDGPELDAEVDNVRTVAVHGVGGMHVDVVAHVVARVVAHVVARVVAHVADVDVAAIQDKLVGQGRLAPAGTHIKSAFSQKINCSILPDGSHM